MCVMVSAVLSTFGFCLLGGYDNARLLQQHAYLFTLFVAGYVLFILGSTWEYFCLSRGGIYTTLPL